MTSQSEKFDFIVVGAGPAGIASAIFAAKKGKKVVIIEKADKIAPEPRGETLHDNLILSKLLGNGFMDSIALSYTAEREFYSPDGTDIIKKTRKTPSIVFDWHQWVERLKEILEGLKIPLLLNSKVTEIIIEDDIVSGVIYEDSDGTKHEILGKATFACDGHLSTIGHKLKVDYKMMNFPIMKCIMKHGNFETKGFKYWFIPTGSLEFAPNFPPIIAFIFPREDKNFETGIMIQMDLARKLKLPPLRESEIMRVWVKLKDQYPIFSEMLKGSSIIYEKLSAIPMIGEIEDFSPKKGVVLMGDAAGFLEVSGGSGLVQSIIMADIWVSNLSDALNKSSDMKVIWSDKNHKKYKKQFKKAKIFKHIHKVARSYNWMRELLFVKWGSTETIMKNWKYVRLIFGLT